MRRRSTSVARSRAYLPKEWSEGLLSSRDIRLLASADGLANLEALELGMAEVEGLVLSGPLVSGPKGFGSGPGLERGPALPYVLDCASNFNDLRLQTATKRHIEYQSGFVRGTNTSVPRLPSALCAA